MKIKQYDKVLLLDGADAVIVEIFDDGKAFIADVNRRDGTVTEWVEREDIAEFF